MKALISKLIHIVIMPCSHVPLQIECERAGSLSFVKRFRLRMHLSVCKWCAAYAKKVEQIDRLLTKKTLDDKKSCTSKRLKYSNLRIK